MLLFKSTLVSIFEMFLVNANKVIRIWSRGYSLNRSQNITRLRGHQLPSLLSQFFKTMGERAMTCNWTKE